VGIGGGFQDPPKGDTSESRLRGLVWVNDIALGCDYIGNYDIHIVDAVLRAISGLPVSAEGWGARYRPEPHGDARAPGPETPDASHVALRSRTLELLLDVDLPVSISFGKAELPMRDVLKLTTGSIVELNCGANEPVEVLVNHCPIARGEVVVVEGNYGVRIQQIISRQERIRSLR